MTESRQHALPIAVAVVECDGKYLIGQRSAQVDQGGLWEFPGGKIHEGETASEAAVRECAEETGLQIESISCLSVVQHQFQTTDRHDSRGETYWIKISFMACQLDDDQAPPLAPFRWVAARDLVDYEFPAANTSVIQRLVADADHA